MSDATVENTTTSGTETTPLSLAKRLVNCKHFRWLPGMLAIRWTGPCRGSHRYTDAEVRAGVTFHRGTPDLTDAATLGCLVALVREVAQEPSLHVRCMLPYAPDMGGKTPPPWVLHSGRGQRWGDRHDTEAEALVAALEAAS